MIFVFDAGNTNTVLGVFENNQLTYEWRIKTDRHRTEDEFGMLIKSLFDHKDIRFSDFTGVIISSVVPPIMVALEKMCEEYFDLKLLIIGRENVDSHLGMAYPHPEEIGADRIVNAVYVIEIYVNYLIVIDFGTATNYCYFNEKMKYTRILIAAEIKISLEALYSKFSKLPKLESQSHLNIVGTTTVDAMQAGVFDG